MVKRKRKNERNENIQSVGALTWWSVRGLESGVKVTIRFIRNDGRLEITSIPRLNFVGVRRIYISRNIGGNETEYRRGEG